MNYTDTDGNPATGVVWSPGPLPGTVWVLPEAGASSSRAVVVHVRKRQQIAPHCVQSGIREAVLTLKDADGFEHKTHMIGAPGDLAERAAHRQAFNDGTGLIKKDWHAALGFIPAERVQCFESNDEPTLLDLTA